MQALTQPAPHRSGVFVHVPRIMPAGRIAIWRAEESVKWPYAVDRSGRGYDLKSIIDGAIAINLSMANSLLSAGEQSPAFTSFCCDTQSEENDDVRHGLACADDAPWFRMGGFGARLRQSDDAENQILRLRRAPIQCCRLVRRAECRAGQAVSNMCRGRGSTSLRDCDSG
jgi:hypothetical protein